MRVGEIEESAGLEEMRDHIRPAHHVRQPAQAAPGDEDDVEQSTAFEHAWRVVDVCLHEVRPPRELQLVGKAAGRLDRHRREIEPDDVGALLCQGQRVSPEMALEVQDALAANVAELALLDGVEQAPARPEPVQIVAWCNEMMGDPLVPVRPVCLDPILCRRLRGRHVFLPCLNGS
jgi:hypothetical protein